MAEYDRLSALMTRFALSAEPSAPETANFLVVADPAGARVILLGQSGAFVPPADGTLRIAARIDWGGADNPLRAALPPVIEQDADEDPELRALVDLLISEHRMGRCGGVSVRNRLVEVLIVKLLRGLLERGAVQGGLLGGLSDPRLSRAIVALHEAPGRAWSNADMADVAGLSVSRFTDLFRRAVGTTPGAYLRGWRLTLAKQDIARGDRIDAVARRYGYGSGEALTHMVRRAMGHSPMALRKAHVGERA
ncbi:MAG: AraC family transcriptional regulator [Rhodobacteraceae bacterium]|nr:AraC family transcriptional regulator [Paracoccaceae bacterium]